MSAIKLINVQCTIDSLPSYTIRRKRHLLNQFQETKSHEEQLKLIWDNSHIKISTNESNERKKNASFAKNQLEKTKKAKTYSEAIIHCNLGLMALSEDNLRLKVMLMQSKACFLFELNEYVACIELSDQILKELPSSDGISRFKIYERMTICAKKLGNASKVVSLCKKALDSITESKVPQEMKTKCINGLKSSLRQTKKVFRQIGYLSSQQSDEAATQVYSDFTIEKNEKVNKR